MASDPRRLAFDEELADRAREVLAELAPQAGEVKMFGGLAFMVNTHMACGLIGNDLMVRVGPDAHDDALARGATEMDFTGRTMRGMVVVPGPALRDPDVLTAMGRARCGVRPHTATQVWFPR